MDLPCPDTRASLGYSTVRLYVSRCLRNTACVRPSAQLGAWLPRYWPGSLPGDHVCREKGSHTCMCLPAQICTVRVMPGAQPLACSSFRPFFGCFLSADAGFTRPHGATCSAALRCIANLFLAVRGLRRHALAQGSYVAGPMLLAQMHWCSPSGHCLGPSGK